MNLRRMVFVAALVCLAMSVAMAQPAAALSVASEHTTESDFDAGQTTNMTASGGEEGQLGLDSDTIADSWEPIDEGDERPSTQDWTGIKLSTESSPITNVSVDISAIDTERAILMHDNETVIEETSVSFSHASFDAELDADSDYIIAVARIEDAAFDYTPVEHSASAGVDAGVGVDVTDGYRDGSTMTNYWSIDELDYDYKESRNGSYASAAHDAEEIEQGIVDLDLDNVDASVEWEARGDGGAWETVGTDSTSVSAEVSTELTAGDYDEYRVNVNVSPTEMYGEATITRDAVLFNASAPILDNASADPQGGETVFGSPIELSINVSDDDFELEQGDSVELEWFVNGEAVDTTTVAEDATESIELSNPEAGTQEWSVTATDSYGETDDSDTFSFETPDEIQIFNESAPDDLVDGEAEVTVRFFREGSDEVIQRTTTDGAVSMSGLPADEPIIVSAEADGYLSRTSVIESLLEQQSMFLLPEGEENARVEFRLNDETGNFQEGETTLYIQRSLNQSNETRWRPISGDRFGATDTLVFRLADDDRYRLVVKNDDSDTRSLGSYRTDGDDLRSLRIGQVRYPGADDRGAGLAASIVESDGSESMRVTYVDREIATTSLDFLIVRDRDDHVVLETTETNIGREFVETIPFSEIEDHREDDSYRVTYAADRGELRPVEGERIIGDLPKIAEDWDIDPDILEMIGYLTVAMMFGLIVILSPRHAGIVASSVAALLSIIGVIGINSLLLGFAFVVSGLFAVAGRR